MSRHGQLIDGEYKDDVYTLFSSYFDNPIMKKIRDVNSHSMYGVKIHALLGIVSRYVIAFCKQDVYPIGNEVSLSNLRWVSIQTRTLDENYPVHTHTYIPARHYLTNEINLFKQDNTKYSYTVEELPLLVTLLPSGKSQGMEYNSKGTLVTALETYNTIVNFK